MNAFPDPQEADKVEILLNNTSSIIELTKDNPFVDISFGCLPGKNTILIRNDNALLFSLEFYIEVRFPISICDFLDRMPRDVSSVLDLSVLSLDHPEDNSGAQIIQHKASQICPITLLLISFPCKGRNCGHSQLFDARSFLKLASTTSHWKCPICSISLLPEELILHSL